MKRFDEDTGAGDCFMVSGERRVGPVGVEGGVSPSREGLYFGPMRQALKDSPTQWVLVGGGAGLLLYVLGIGLCFSLRTFLPIQGRHWQNFAGGGHFGVLLGFLMILLGVGLTGGTLLRVDSGIKKGRWKEEELEPLRRIFGMPMLKFVLVGGFVVLTAGFSLLPPNSEMKSLGLFCFFPLQMLASLGTSLRKPDDSSGLGLGAPHDSIRSEHWGER